MSKPLSELFNNGTLFSDEEKINYLKQRSLIQELYENVDIEEIKIEYDSFILDNLNNIMRLFCNEESIHNTFSTFLNTLNRNSGFKKVTINVFDFRISEPHGMITLFAHQNENGEPSNYDPSEEVMTIDEFEEIFTSIGEGGMRFEDEGIIENYDYDSKYHQLLETTYYFISRLTEDFMKRAVQKYFTKENLTELNINYPVSFYYNEDYDGNEATEGTLLLTLEA
ncbi:hypothetical protein ATO12_05605 [Aquimarina atlantica]|uniref:Uncharacterized protein n=1 Tax=Aquimarina atlantica TaxID=1317122 RepID=A0A023BP41_9FLAO|nr:hypothetical protein [Aquimarina atlantica]EZH71855.1 hypothetical protein ATO12_05605 [Aquimarina atlantica]